MDSKNFVTSSLQDYLETIFSLSRENKIARVTDIAERMEIAKPSVIQALSMLKDKGLIHQVRYGPVELTEKGRKYAGEIFLKHQVLYGFLTQILGVTAEIAEQDACLIEHVLSRETFNKLLEFMRKQELASDLKKIIKIAD